MAVTKTEMNVAQEIIDLLLGNQSEAEAYAQDPQGWLDGHGYQGVSAEALHACGAALGSGGGGGAGGGTAVGGAQVAAPPAAAGSLAQLDHIVYNHYITDHSITNNIVNHGALDFSQQVAGDGSVQAGGDIADSSVNTGTIDESTNIDESVNVDSGGGGVNVEQTNIDESVNAGGDIDQSTNIDQSIEDRSTSIDAGGDVATGSGVVAGRDVDQELPDW